MKDFLKIFFFISALVVAFTLGRNYGRHAVEETKEYQKTQAAAAQADLCTAQIATLKEQFQKLLDNADLKKAHEVLSQIMTIFLADLGLHLSDQQQKNYEEGVRACAQVSTEQRQSDLVHNQQQALIKIQTLEKKEEQKQENFLVNYKETEARLTLAATEAEISQNLKKLELKDLDSYLKQASPRPANECKDFLGTYEGVVLDLNKKIYGELRLNIEEILRAGKPALTGAMRLLKNGQGESTSRFTSDDFGFSAPSSATVIVGFGERRFLQLLPVAAQQKLAGFYYERLPNGTTKTIGHFILDKAN